MRTFWIFAAISFAAFLPMKAQKAFQKKDHSFAFGMSIYLLHPPYLTDEFYKSDPYGNRYYAYGLYVDYTAYARTPINFKYELGVSDHIGLGISLGYFKTVVMQ